MDKREKAEIEQGIKEANEIYKYIENNRLYQDWMGDTERFMAFTYLGTRNLVKHSVVLTRLTRWLIGLTIALTVITIAQLFC